MHAPENQSASEVACRVRLFAAARQTLGVEAATIHLTAPYTIARLKDQISEQFPKIANLVQQSRIAVNAAYASNEQLINTADEIALIPPVSGG